MTALGLLNLYPSELALVCAALVFMVFWIWAILHCAIRTKNRKAKALWLIFIILVGYIGAPAYLVSYLTNKTDES